MSDSGYDNMLRRLNHLKATHKKIHLKSRRDMIKKLYILLREELYGEIITGISMKDDSITIRVIIPKKLLICDEANSLVRLLGSSNLLMIGRIRNKIKIDMWFRLWEWR